MRKYFLDTEFIEGSQSKFLWGQTKPTIDLISIGMVNENAETFYAISNEFNLKEAWYRWEQRTGHGDYNNINPKDYWIRENVLRPLFIDLKSIYVKDLNKITNQRVQAANVWDFNYPNLKWLLKRYGKSNAQIANLILMFIYPDNIINDENKPEFYGYYADYDWVVFCWIFGKMIDLPQSFPKYCNDLKQMMGDKSNILRALPDYPKQTNEHNALDDAIWNRLLYLFLKDYELGLSEKPNPITY